MKACRWVCADFLIDAGAACIFSVSRYPLAFLLFPLLLLEAGQLHMSSVQTLVLVQNQVSELRLKELPRLQSLTVESPRVTNIDLRRLPALKTLALTVPNLDDAELAD